MFTSSRLSLRKFETFDLGFLCALDNDPRVMKYINGGVKTPTEFISEKILPLFRLYDDDKPGIGYWIVSLLQNPAPIGWCCIREHSVTPSLGTLGFRFLPENWGKGYATESSEALLRYGFREYGFSSVRATTYGQNTGSQRTLEKLGFKLIRKFRLDLSKQQTAYFESIDPWPDWDLEYNLDHEMWQAQRGT